MISPEATYDALIVVGELADAADGISDSETMLFSYLSCLLAMYDQRAPSDWGYSFVATKTAAPYSDAIVAASESLTRRSMLIAGDEGYWVSDAGRLLSGQLTQLDRFSFRIKYLKAACNSALAIPMPQVGEAVAAEPQLRRAFELASTRPLLDESGAAALHDHFAAVSASVPGSADLLVPAVVWLSYLASTMQDSESVPRS